MKHPYFQEIARLFAVLLDEDNNVLIEYSGKNRDIILKMQVRGRGRVFITSKSTLRIKSIKKYKEFIALSCGTLKIREYEKVFEKDLLSILEDIFTLENAIISGERFAFNLSEAIKIYRGIE